MGDLSRAQQRIHDEFVRLVAIEIPGAEARTSFDLTEVGESSVRVGFAVQYERDGQMFRNGVMSPRRPSLASINVPEAVELLKQWLNERLAA